MGHKKRVHSLNNELSKLKRNPVPTFFTLLIDRQRPYSQPDLDLKTVDDFIDYKCSCEKAPRRFTKILQCVNPSETVTSDGYFALSIMCQCSSAVKEAVKIYRDICKLRRLDQATKRLAELKQLVLKFAERCEHRKILPRIFHADDFKPYPVIPSRRMHDDGIHMMEPSSDSDPDSNPDDEKPNEPAFPDCQAVFAYNTQINGALVDMLKQKLPLSWKNPKSQMPGFIYILKSLQIPNKLKIGFTTKDPAVRKHEWHRCYPNIKLHAYTNKIPYAKLVESLIHTELMAQRYQHKCTTCRGKSTKERYHQEWFGISEQLAEQVVLRWAKWMGSRPYHSDTRKLSRTWVQRLEKVLEKGCKPALDHVQYENTWQSYTDMRRTKDQEDDSAAVELIIAPEKTKSKFSDSVEV